MVTVFEKPLPRGWRIRKNGNTDTDHPVGRGANWDEHVLISPGGHEFEHSDWEWVEPDRNDILYARGGCLWRQTIRNQTDLAAPKLVHDFNMEAFSEREAPY